MVDLVNAPVATVSGGFFAQYGSTVTGLSRGAQRRKAAMALSRRGTLALQEMMKTLNGATPAVATSKTLSRVEANSEQGGARTIETVTLIDENTAAADITTVAGDILDYDFYDEAPVANLDDNPLGTR